MPSGGHAEANVQDTEIGRTGSNLRLTLGGVRFAKSCTRAGRTSVTIVQCAAAFLHAATTADSSAVAVEVAETTSQTESAILMRCDQ